MNLKMPSNKQELFNQILNPNYFNEECKEDALIMRKSIAVAKCIEYLVDQLQKVGFAFEAGEKTYNTFEILLEDYSVAQIYGAIWRSVAEASKLYLEGKCLKNTLPTQR